MYRRAPESSVFTVVKQGYICSSNTIVGSLLVKLKFYKNMYSEHLDNGSFIVLISEINDNFSVVNTSNSCKELFKVSSPMD